MVLLSSTPDKGVNSPFHGSRTNLAGLFQINGVARVHGLMETWNTWQPQKPIFGQNRKVTLTVYVVSGTAPKVAPAHRTGVISNTVTVPFTISGAATAPSATTATTGSTGTGGIAVPTHVNAGTGGQAARVSSSTVARDTELAALAAGLLLAGSAGTRIVRRRATR